MSDLRRLVLDVLKPHTPSIVEMAKRLGALKGVDGVSLALEEVDQETESVKVTIEGTQVDFEKVSETIRQVGGVIHSVDSVAAGKKLVEDVHTPQDR
ncbi:MAG TPA: DUF211 domain-containing protein [Thermoplasmata archaeon]|nr:DUF211 domain-containing protein [Thermoplasmata archaeon]